MLRKIKGGYLPGSEDVFDDKYVNGNIYNEGNYNHEDDSFGLGELESPICRPLPEEAELPEDPELIEQDEPDNGDNEDNRSEDRDTHNLNSALEYLRSHAYAQYSRENCGHCARAVRSALEAGDIVVHESYSENKPEGHIAMYDGQNWISDYYQTDMFGGAGYRNNQDFTIWRYNW